MPMSNFIVLCWTIWNSRNNRVYEGKRVEIEFLWEEAVSLTTQYNEAQKSRGCEETSKTTVHRWKKPGSGFKKLNTNTGMIKNEDAGLGAICRDEEGNWIFIAEEHSSNGKEVLTLELEALLLGMKLVDTFNISHLIIKSNNLVAVKSINEIDGECLTEDRVLILEARAMLRKHQNWLLFHVHRGANFAAHYIAKHALGCKEHKIWGDCLPLWVSPITCNDLLSD